ncbi:MAG: lipoyl(octanoyl) transferase LipB [bacterium]
MRQITSINLPTTDYGKVLELQRDLFTGLLNGIQQQYLILCEHLNVYTLGRATDEANILFSDSELEVIGAEKYLIERGGDVTYHGPGQLVGYPLLNLSTFTEDLGWYLRAIEETIITTIANYGITGYRIAGLTGVWVNVNGDDEKICAIGIKASKWCTMHGFALNVNTNLAYFDRIIPCGIGDKRVTSMEKLLGRQIDMQEIQHAYSRAFESVFHVELVNSTDQVSVLESVW